MTIRTLAMFTLALGVVALPASATIQYSYCTSGCNSTTGDYPTWQTGPGSAGLTFSMSPITFSAGNLSGGVYTDGTGTLFTGYTGSSIDTLSAVSGTSFVQGASGTGTGIEITLPATAYAFAMVITSPNGFQLATVGVGTHGSNTAAYTTTVPSANSPVFFGILSDAPLGSLFINAGFGGKLQVNSFELGSSGGGGGAAPEASTLVLIGSGLVALGFLGRRRVHKPDGPRA